MAHAKKGYVLLGALLALGVLASCSSKEEEPPVALSPLAGYEYLLVHPSYYVKVGDDYELLAPSPHALFAEEREDLIRDAHGAEQLLLVTLKRDSDLEILSAETADPVLEDESAALLHCFTRHERKGERVTVTLSLEAPLGTALTSFTAEASRGNSLELACKGAARKLVAALGGAGN